MGTPTLWIAFNVGVLVLIAIDLLVVQGHGGKVSTKSAAFWTAGWISLSLLFCVFIGWRAGPTVAIQFFTGYVVEYALSVDNLFVFLMVFSYFRVQGDKQHLLLYWGILGALVMRAGLILLGAALVAKFHWVLYIFGGFLIYTAIKMGFSKDSDQVDPDKTPVLRFARRFLPIARGETGKKFLVRQDGQWRFTTLFLVLLVIETTDLIFALDSIPAVLGITQDPFIVYSSNVCAIMGLRSLFFVVSSLMDKFHYLKVGLSLVLAFVGVKMIVEGIFHPNEQQKNYLIVGSLAFIALVLAGSILVSILKPLPRTEKGN